MAGRWRVSATSTSRRTSRRPKVPTTHSSAGGITTSAAGSATTRRSIAGGEGDSEVVEQAPEGLAVEALGGGAYHVCAVRKADGHIDCWGSSGEGKLSAPTPAEAVEMLAGG